MSEKMTSQEFLNQFKSLDGEQFGGGKNHVELDAGQMAGPFVHVKIETGVKLTADSEPIDLYIATDEHGDETRMPASAVFRRNADDAKLKTGDIYYIYRDSDAVKKKGKGKGRSMAVYLIKVTQRVKSSKR
jgi:hypothetical protein